MIKPRIVFYGSKGMEPTIEEIVNTVAVSMINHKTIKTIRVYDTRIFVDFYIDGLNEEPWHFGRVDDDE